jgi:DNA adenine methylase
MMKKSYLKYTGSKQRVLEQLLPILGNPTTLIEPFFGSGTVSLNMPNVRVFMGNDLNRQVIQTHKKVISNPEKVINYLVELRNTSWDYYQLRDSFNRQYGSEVWDAWLAAAFIYLNRHCYNGLMRYNRNGAFNVPEGRTSSGKLPLLPVSEIREFADKFSGDIVSGTSLNIPKLSLFNEDFATFMQRFESPIQNSVIYCDPPYIPVAASDFNYTSEGFTATEQKVLADLAKELSLKGNKVIISNHDTPLARELYKDADQLLNISAYRSVAGKSGSRGNVQELVAVYGE